MVFILFHDEYVGTGKEREENLDNWINRLMCIGWTRLRWCQKNDLRDPRECRDILIGCPPGYKGPYDSRSYYEEVLITLHDPDNFYNEVDKIKVRNILSIPESGNLSNSHDFG